MLLDRFALPLGVRWITTLALLLSACGLIWQSYAMQTKQQHLLKYAPKIPVPLPSAATLPPISVAPVATADITNAVTARLATIATESGLALNMISINPAQSNSVARQQVSLSTQLTGAYGASKIFMAKTLAEFPNLSINRVAQQRERDQVRTDVQWTLFIGRTQ